MTKLQKAIMILQQKYKNYVLRGDSEMITVTELIDLLNAQAYATEEPKRLELPDETKAWLDEMDAVEALGTIANICSDWDGYRTADALGGLINEIWAYARYCADKLEREQGPVVPKRELRGASGFRYYCGACGVSIEPNHKYCRICGRAAKWND